MTFLTELEACLHIPEHKATEKWLCQRIVLTQKSIRSTDIGVGGNHRRRISKKQQINSTTKSGALFPKHGGTKAKKRKNSCISSKEMYRAWIPLTA